MIPRPDYNTRYLLWKYYIKYYGGDWSSFRFLNLSLLTKLTDKFPAGAIKALCERVITEKRITNVKLFTYIIIIYYIINKLFIIFMMMWLY